MDMNLYLDMNLYNLDMNLYNLDINLKILSA